MKGRAWMGLTGGDGRMNGFDDDDDVADDDDDDDPRPRNPLKIRP